MGLGVGGRGGGIKLHESALLSWGMTVARSGQQAVASPGRVGLTIRYEQG